MNDAIVHFVLGSSPVITIFPFVMLYTAYNNLTPDERENSRISLSTLCITLPFMYGIIFAMLYNVLSIIPRKTKDTYTRFVVCGALTALIISLILHYVFQIHTDWLKLENPTIYHIGIFVFYLAVFFTIGQWVRAQVLYGPTSPSSSSSSSSPSSPSSSHMPVQPSVNIPKMYSPSVNTAASASKFDAIQAKANK